MAEYLITWNELAGLGLPMERISIRENPSGGIAEITVYGQPSEAQMAKLNKIRKEAGPRPGILRERLNTLFSQAERNPGQPQRIPDLGRGLGVDMLVMVDGTIKINIHRPNVDPSESEWKTVLQNFPFAVVTDGTPIRFSKEQRHYMQASLLVAQEAMA